jgi:hypothetical protein
MSSPSQILGSWVRIPLKAWMDVCVFSVCVVKRSVSRMSYVPSGSKRNRLLLLLLLLLKISQAVTTKTTTCVNTISEVGQRRRPLDMESSCEFVE